MERLVLLLLGIAALVVAGYGLPGGSEAEEKRLTESTTTALDRLASNTFEEQSRSRRSRGSSSSSRRSSRSSSRRSSSSSSSSEESTDLVEDGVNVFDLLATVLTGVLGVVACTASIVDQLAVLGGGAGATDIILGGVDCIFNEIITFFQVLLML